MLVILIQQNIYLQRRGRNAFFLSSQTGNFRSDPSRFRQLLRDHIHRRDTSDFNLATFFATKLDMSIATHRHSPLFPIGDSKWVTYDPRFDNFSKNTTLQRDTSVSPSTASSAVETLAIPPPMTRPTTVAVHRIAPGRHGGLLDRHCPRRLPRNPGRHGDLPNRHRPHRRQRNPRSTRRPSRLPPSSPTTARTTDIIYLSLIHI